MQLQELQNYVSERNKEGLVKIEVSMEVEQELMNDTYYITKTKESYVYGSEQEADAKIDAVRQLIGFAGCDKKFKPGKVSKKTGEEISPDTYTVVVKLNH
jgi:hypothetical protein